MKVVCTEKEKEVLMESCVSDMGCDHCPLHEFCEDNNEWHPIEQLIELIPDDV